MEAAVKRDQFVTLGVITRQLDRTLYRFRPGIAEEHFPLLRLWHRRNQFFRELRHVPMAKIRPGDVNHLGRLLLNGRNHLRMAVARRADRNPRGEIEKRISVRVFDNGARRALRHQRVITRQRWRHEFRVVGDHFLRFGPGQCCLNSG